LEKQEYEAELPEESDGALACSPTGAAWADQYSKRQFKDDHRRSKERRQAGEQRRQNSYEGYDEKRMDFAHDPVFRRIAGISIFKQPRAAPSSNLLRFESSERIGHDRSEGNDLSARVPHMRAKGSTPSRQFARGFAELLDE
jgi:hypothetical protein